MNATIDQIQQRRYCISQVANGLMRDLYVNQFHMREINLAILDVNFFDR